MRDHKNQDAALGGPRVMGVRRLKGELRSQEKREGTGKKKRGLSRQNIVAEGGGSESLGELRTAYGVFTQNEGQNGGKKEPVAKYRASACLGLGGRGFQILPQGHPSRR